MQKVLLCSFCPAGTSATASAVLCSLFCPTADTRSVAERSTRQTSANQSIRMPAVSVGLFQTALQPWSYETSTWTGFERCWREATSALSARTACPSLFCTFQTRNSARILHMHYAQERTFPDDSQTSASRLPICVRKPRACSAILYQPTFRGVLRALVFLLVLSTVCGSLCRRTSAPSAPRLLAQETLPSNPRRMKVAVPDFLESLSNACKLLLLWRSLIQKCALRSNPRQIASHVLRQSGLSPLEAFLRRDTFWFYTFLRRASC